MKELHKSTGSATITLKIEIKFVKISLLTSVNHFGKGEGRVN